MMNRTFSEDIRLLYSTLSIIHDILPNNDDDDDEASPSSEGKKKSENLIHQPIEKATATPTTSQVTQITTDL